jgi:hypothetical protein
LTNQPNKEKIVIFLNNQIYDEFELFLKEIAIIINNDKNMTKIEINTKTLNNLILLTVITLNDIKIHDENNLHNYIELYFKNVDNKMQKIEEENDEDLDEISSYSTVSSILGIQVNKLFIKLN